MINRQVKFIESNISKTKNIDGCNFISTRSFADGELTEKNIYFIDADYHLILKLYSYILIKKLIRLLANNYFQLTMKV